MDPLATQKSSMLKAQMPGAAAPSGMPMQSPQGGQPGGSLMSAGISPQQHQGLAQGMSQQANASGTPPHPLKKQLLQHLISTFLSAPRTTVQDAIAGVKGLMGAYGNIAKEIDSWAPGTQLDYTRQPDPAPYNPQGGNSSATMAQHYPNGFSQSNVTPQTPANPPAGYYTP